MAEKVIIHTDNAPKAIGPYSQAVKAGQFIYTSGSLGIDPTTGKLVEGGIEAQTATALSNMKAILEAAGTSVAHVVKTTVFVTDIRDFPKVNTLYGEFFKESPPARSTVQVAALPLGGVVEIEAVALAD
ncbi:MAG: RidA family protein [Candidatus Eremiobacteraeota bacterium]|nr:RidA family protein [Candidatus Eremiobacteraeota bacterium]